MQKTNAKCKKCRREGKKLFLKGERCFSAKCAIVKRNYPPGIHGTKARTKSKRGLSAYGQQLREKQVAKKVYNLNEKQFANYFKKAIRQKGDTGENLLQFLELRLDNVIYRVGLVSSRKLARQLVSHGYFQVNGKNINIPSYNLKTNDKITIKPAKINKKILDNIKESIKEKKDNFSSWLNLDKDSFAITILAKPNFKEVERLFDIKMIVEFYSK
ncbi:MAG: 30S ribosomal protein S4 [bacterium]